MLDQSYFSGQREKEFLALKEMALQLKGHINSAVAVETSSFLVDLYIDPSIYQSIKKFDNSLLVYLLLWCRNTRVKRQDGVLTVLHPFINGQETFETREYILEDRILGPFFLAQLYTEDPDYELYCNMMKIGGVSGGYFPPQRESIDDAQLKIMLDVILAVEAMVASGQKKGDRYKILVVGSAHEIAKRSGRAYDVISRIAPGSDVFLYDPCGANYVMSIGDTVYTHISKLFSYVDVEGYDLILDDTWVEGQLHINRDPNEVSFDIPHFSVKRFPEEGMPGNVYYQAFRTDRRETRAVSRNIDYKYRSIEGLGVCSACDELRFLMKGDWLLSDLYMSTHKVDCLTGKRRLDIDHLDFSHESWKPYKPGKVDMFKCLPWDNFLQLPSVTLNEAVLLSSNVIVSRWENVPIGLVNRIGMLVIVHQGNWYSNDQDKADALGLEVFKTDDYPHLELSDAYIENFNWMANTAKTNINRGRGGFQDRRKNFRKGNKIRKTNFTKKHKFGQVKEDGVKLKTKDGDQTVVKI